MRWQPLVWIVGLLAVTAIVDVSCAPVASPGLDPRALARGTVETLESVWNVSAKSCVDVAVAADSKDVLKACQDALNPARGAIILAADAVDGWTDADQKNFPCLIADSMAGIGKVIPLLQTAGVQLPQVVADGYTLANMYLPQCKRDGGK